ncbi:hypothetical protein ACQJBY_048203 [Aegilops geniculata]
MSTAICFLDSLFCFTFFGYATSLMSGCISSLFYHSIFFFLTFLVFCFFLADGKHHFVGSCLANVYSNMCVLCLTCGITVGRGAWGDS